MAGDIESNRIETKAIVLGYAMSRLDNAFLSTFGYDGWSQAYNSLSTALGQPGMTFKNLRDEFDPFHSNSRLGWWKRPLRQSRQRVMDELADVSDEALIELVRSIVRQDNDATAEAIDSLAVVTKRAYNIAERLLTGRMAEEFFLQNCQEIADENAADIVDCRNSACGFDFSTRRRPEIAIEVKGLKDSAGSILFTDFEWSVATDMGSDYLLVVVGNLRLGPQAVVIVDPARTLDAACIFQQTLTASWRARVSLH